MILAYRSLMFVCGLAVAFCDIVEAQVVINEIGAADSETLLRSHPDGRSRLGWGPSWCEQAFDDMDWLVGTSPFGFGAEGIATDLGEQMRGRTPSVYLRKTFTVSAEVAALAESFTLLAQADSGFVAFINGHEIARANLGQRNGFVYHDQSTFSNAESDQMLSYESVILASDVLQAGENVLAVQVQNSIPAQINERDQTIDERLKFEASLTIGANDTPVVLTEDEWHYRVGYAEPSGGVVDWAQAAHPGGEGDFSDWIELHNQGAEAVDLSGWHLSDDRDQPYLWPFPDNITIGSEEYLVVLADRKTELAGDYLHANFGLSQDGEFLSLNNASGESVSSFEDSFPQQAPFHSYGLDRAGAYVYFANPSPGAANDPESQLKGWVKRLRFEPAGGVYDEPVLLTISSNTEDAVIRYTLDGSEPTEMQGALYDGPISIDAMDDRTGTPVRARAFKQGLVASLEGTQTYLVGVDAAFKTIPSVSIVGDPGDSFYLPHGVMSIVGRSIPRVVTDYYMPAMHGRPFERKVSMEVIYPNNTTNIQINGGLRLSASAFSRANFSLTNREASPWTSEPPQKPSFNLFFRNAYGEDTLNFPFVENYPVREFHQFRIRAGKNDIVSPFIVDELARRIYTDTGQFGSVGIQHALFLNGSYKGYYNTVARLREQLFQDAYGSEEPWQVKHIDVWADGSPFEDKLLDTPEWMYLESLLRKDLRELENYQAVTEELDPVSFADYFIVNLYGATEDWPHNNLVIARELSDVGRWRAYMWDAEVCFGVQSSHSLTFDSIATDLTQLNRTPSNDLATVWSRLIISPEWRLLFADRLQKHFFSSGGALTKQNLTRRVEELETEIAPLMAFAGTIIDTSEIAEWVEGREEELFAGGIWESHELWGGIPVPVISPASGTVGSGTVVTFALDPMPARTSVYYTTDGSDPRLPGGDLNPTAIRANADLIVDATMTIKARAQSKTVFSSTWGALIESEYRVGLEPASANNFIISELMVEPEAPNETEAEGGFAAANFEYVEFHNPSDVAIDLSELRFAAGVDYVFKQGDVTTLAAKAYGVIVSDRLAFEQRFGDGLPILGEYGKKLNNDGEQLEIVEAGSFEAVSRVAYSNVAPWPANDDGRSGHSLVFTSPLPSLDANDPTNWTLSASQGGTPGRAKEGGDAGDGGYDGWKMSQFTDEEQADAAISGPDRDPDQDGASNFAEFAFGANPKDPTLVGKVVVERQGDDLILVLIQRTDPTIQYALEGSKDLIGWKSLEAIELRSEAQSADLKIVTYRTLAIGNADAVYLRWRAE